MTRRVRSLVAAPLGVLLTASIVAGCASTTPSDAPASGPATSPSSAALATPTPSPSTAVPGASPSPAVPGASSEPPAAPASPEPTASPAPGVVGLPDPTASPRPEPGQGDGIFLETGRVRVPGTDVRLTLPNDWWTVDVDGQDLAAIIDALPGKAAGGLSDEILALVADRLELAAVDLQPANRGASLTGVTVDIAVPAGPFAETVLAAGVDIALEAAGVSDARTQAMTVDGRPAIRAEYRVKAGSGAARTTYLVTQVYLALEGEVLVITIAIPKGGQAGDADRIVRSLDAG